MKAVLAGPPNGKSGYTGWLPDSFPRHGEGRPEREPVEQLEARRQVRRELRRDDVARRSVQRAPIVRDAADAQRVDGEPQTELGVENCIRLRHGPEHHGAVVRGPRHLEAIEVERLLLRRRGASREEDAAGQEGKKRRLGGEPLLDSCHSYRRSGCLLRLRPPRSPDYGWEARARRILRCVARIPHG